MDQLPFSLHSLPTQVNRLYLAFSGGLDSVVLLHNLLRYRHRYQIVLWHINHGLQPEAKDMEAFSRAEATSLQLDIRVDHLELDASAGNVEATARRHRYDLFAARLTKRDALLTAHHANDQAETLMLNLMRGSGPSGLRAIARHKALGQGVLLRPLLDATREDIRKYAELHQLREEGAVGEELHLAHELQLAGVALREALDQGLGRVRLHVTRHPPDPESTLEKLPRNRPALLSRCSGDQNQLAVRHRRTSQIVSGAGQARRLDPSPTLHEYH